MTPRDLCLSLPVYARPDADHFIGYLQSEALVPDGPRLVPAINLKIRVDGDDWSVWRRQSELMTWYIRADQPLLEECRWIENHRRWDPTDLEISLDQRIWLLGGGKWTRHRGLRDRFSI